ncbi:MAG: hypothetical protein IJ217_01810 [Clostridia bacterium]|nr:hypothetical protein [Clostridia bacterium]
MKKLKVMLQMLIIVCTISSLCFAISTTDITVDDSTGVSGIVGAAAQRILNLVAIAAAAVAVGMLAYIGVKYATKGAGGKADVKETLLPYLIGAILIATASTITSAVLSMGASL